MTFFFISLFMLLVFWRPQDWLFLWLYGWPVLDVIFGLGLVAFLVEFATGRIKSPRNIPQVYLLVGLFFAGLMSHVANTYLGGLISSFPELFKITAFTVLLTTVLDRPSRLRAMSWMFVVMACIMAVHALLQERTGAGFIGRPPLFIPAYGGTEAHTRSYFFGIFGDPNDLAQMLVVSVPLSFGLTKRVGVHGVLLGCIISTLLVFAVLSTHSQGGYLALLVVAAVMVCFWLPYRWLPTLLCSLGVLALIACTFAAGLLDMAAHERVVFWGLANQVFKSSPIFGIGHNMFWQVASDRAAHNAFVSCYTTLGLFGYWFWFGLILLGCIGAWRAQGRLRSAEGAENANLCRFSGLAFAAMCGFCASAYFLSRTFVYPLFFLIAMLAAIPPVTERALEMPPLSLLRVRRDILGYCSIGTVASVFYIYYSIRLLNAAFYG